MLREDFLPDFGLTATSLAEAIGVSRQSINELLCERRSVSPSMALRLAKLFGHSPEFWLNAQRAVDLCDTVQLIETDFTADDFAGEGYFYQRGVPPLRIDILMGIPGVEFEEAWQRRVEVAFDDLPVYSSLAKI